MLKVAFALVLVLGGILYLMQPSWEAVTAEQFAPDAVGAVLERADALCIHARSMALFVGAFLGFIAALGLSRGMVKNPTVALLLCAASGLPFMPSDTWVGFVITVPLAVFFAVVGVRAQDRTESAGVLGQTTYGRA